jgi:citrate synthase
MNTDISMEEPSDNPYVSRKNYIYGYDNVELMNKKRLSDVILLLFTSELPDKEKSELFEKLAVSMINPGPRHPATRASITAGVSKSGEEHLLPIGLMVLGGKSNGALEVQDAMNFILTHIDDNPVELAKKLSTEADNLGEGEIHIAPGFGNLFGSVDIYSKEIIAKLISSYPNSSKVIDWCVKFTEESELNNYSWLRTGLCAAIFIELDVKPREAVSLFQILCSPGIAAHGVEQTHKPISSISLISDDNYHYTKGELHD